MQLSLHRERRGRRRAKVNRHITERSSPLAHNKNSVDQELSAKIESELQMEQEIRDSEKLPTSISDYLDSSSFEVQSTACDLYDSGIDLL